MLTTSLRLPFTFDPEAILTDLSQFSKDDYYNVYNPFLEPDTLWAKHFIEPQLGPEGFPVFHPNEALKNCPYLLLILETFQCEKETFRVHTLNAGASIRPHRDIGRGIEHGVFRIHIPVATNAQIETVLDGQQLSMQPGECWYCNFDLQHEIHNRSDQDRTHLIMDCLTNDWWLQLFKDAGISVEMKQF